MVRSILLTIFGFALGIGILALMESHPTLAVSLLAGAGLIWVIERATRAARLSIQLMKMEEIGMRHATLTHTLYRGFDCPSCFKPLRNRDDFQQEAFKKGTLRCIHCGQEIQLNVKAFKERYH